jgi:DNA mismatch repair ATPase MutS
VIERAKQVLDSLEVHHATDDVPSAASAGQMSLFTQYLEHPAIDRLRSLDLDRMSPMEAFEAIRDLRNTLTEEPPS